MPQSNGISDEARVAQSQLLKRMQVVGFVLVALTLLVGAALHNPAWLRAGGWPF